MNSREPKSYLDFYLAPLQAALTEPEVTDVYVNQPGELWIERLGGDLERREEASLDAATLWRLVRQLASHTHQGISRQFPLLAATLPNGARVQVVAPPATRSALVLAIRQHTAKVVDLASYNDDGVLDDSSHAPWDSGSLLSTGDCSEFLRQAVLRKLNIIVSGGTSAGKTTLLNALIDIIPSQERVVFIEDTPELRLSRPNGVGLVGVRGPHGESEVSTEQLLETALRLGPHRIILGEIRGAEAFSFLRAINTGHPGSMTTLHANSPKGAMTQLAMMALQSGHNIRYEDIMTIIQNQIDIIVQVERRGASRTITEVLLPKEGRLRSL